MTYNSGLSPLFFFLSMLMGEGEGLRGYLDVKGEGGVRRDGRGR